jgi:hypothetical protein
LAKAQCSPGVCKAEPRPGRRSTLAARQALADNRWQTGAHGGGQFERGAAAVLHLLHRV